MSLSLEDLMNVEFYSASKKLESLSGATAHATMDELEAELERLERAPRAFRAELVEGAA